MRLEHTINQARTYYDIIDGTIDAVKDLRSWWRKLHNYTITIESSDDAYDDIQSWILDQLPPDRQRALLAFSAPHNDRETRDRRHSTLHLAYDSYEPQTLNVDGHKITVTLEKGDGKSADLLTFRTTSSAAQRALITALRTTLAKRIDETPKINLAGDWGWGYKRDLIQRPLESVILREGVLESLIEDLSTFRVSEQDYVRRGLPWHRGYLFQGPPGTGKTSVARALATHFGLDLYYAALGDLSKDASLINLLSDVRPNSILLLEDIDVFKAATTRDTETDQLSLSGLLNALDGVSTPHGLITILTSNEPESLDAALIRPGRIDCVIDLDYVTQEQAVRHFTYFYGVEPATKWAIAPRTSTADLTEIFKRHLNDPVAAEADIPKKRVRRAA